jgi:hypothetical protein
MIVPHRKHTYRPPRPVAGISTFLYVHDVRTSQEITYRPPRPVTGITLIFCTYLMFVPHSKHTYIRKMVSSGLLVAACVVPSSPVFVTLMKEAPGSSETSILTRATRRNNPEDTILHSHRRENLKSYTPIYLHGLLQR